MNDCETEPLVYLSSMFTQVHMSKEAMDCAVKAAIYVTLSQHEWVWTQEQQACMAQYVLWASQRIEAMKTLVSERDLVHDPALKEHK